MFGYNWRMLAVLAEAVEGVEIPVDGDAICQAVALIDRLNAKVTEAIGAFDHAGLWELDACTSMTAWLRCHAGQSAGAASNTVRTAKRLRDLPTLTAAWREGAVTGTQVQVVMANVRERTAPLFAEHEAELVPTFFDLSLSETVVAMQEWRVKAESLIDRREPADDTRTAHLSALLDGKARLDATFDPEGAEVVRTALRLATTRDTDAEPARSPARRRADAFVDICRFFLDHRAAPVGARNRPHLNVVVDYQDLVENQPGRLVGGAFLDSVNIRTLLCDAGVHRVVTDGRSAVIDFGTATYQAPASLFAALVVRDQHCRHPGCDRGPEWCDAHHVIPFPHGPTNLSNMVLKCNRHHHLAHKPGWHEKLAPDGSLTITDPNGREWTSHPPGARPFP